VHKERDGFVGGAGISTVVFRSPCTRMRTVGCSDLLVLRMVRLLVGVVGSASLVAALYCIFLVTWVQVACTVTVIIRFCLVWNDCRYACRWSYMCYWRGIGMVELLSAQRVVFLGFHFFHTIRSPLLGAVLSPGVYVLLFNPGCGRYVRYRYGNSCWPHRVFKHSGGIARSIGNSG